MVKKLDNKFFVIILVTICLIVGVIILLLNKEYPDDENTLYSIKFGNTKLRFERYDYALGQNQIVVVEKSTNKGKSYSKLTTEPIVVSMEAKFVFLNDKLGFVVSKPDLTKSNNYLGFKVTQDGGKTFINCTINYDNPNIEILTVEGVPYFEDNLLKLPCSIYQISEDKMGYEDVKLTFVSKDEGLTWNAE